MFEKPKIPDQSPRVPKPSIIDRVVNAADAGLGAVGKKIGPAVEKGVTVASKTVPVVPAALAASVLAYESFHAGKTIGTIGTHQGEKGRTTQQETVVSTADVKANRENLKKFEESLRSDGVSFGDVRESLRLYVEETIKLLGLEDSAGNKMKVLEDIGRLVPDLAVRANEKGKNVGYAVAGYLASEIQRQRLLIAYGQDYAKHLRPQPEESVGGWGSGQDFGNDDVHETSPVPDGGVAPPGLKGNSPEGGGK